MESAQEPATDPRKPIEIIRAGLARRKAAELRFKIYGVVAISAGLLFLAILFITIVGNAYTAFVQTQIKLDLYLDPALLDPDGTHDPDALSNADYGAIFRASLSNLFPEVESRRDRRELNGLVGRGGTYDLRQTVMDDPGLVGKTLTLWVPADDDVDMLLKGHIDRSAPEADRRGYPW